MTATSEYLEGVLHVEDAVRAALSKDLLNLYDWSPGFKVVIALLAAGSVLVWLVLA